MKLAILKESNNKTNQADKRIAITHTILKECIDLGIKEFWLQEEIAKDFEINITTDKKDLIFKKKREEIINNADLFCTILPLNIKETSQTKTDAVFISRFSPFDQIDNTGKSVISKKLAQKEHTVFSLDMIPRTTIAQSVDVLSSLASIAGYKAVLVATEYFNRYLPMLTTAAGTIPPAKVLVIGAGVAGLQAIATAKRLGANVSAFDTRTAAKTDVQSLGAKFIEVEGAIDDKAAGGYAVEQSEIYQQKQKSLIAETITKMDIIITTAQLRGKPAPKLITSEMVKSMAFGSVIIDMASSTGGNCELTKDEEVINVHGVTIIGDSDLSRRVPYHASLLYSKNVLNFLKFLTVQKNGEKKLYPHNPTHEVTKSSCIVLKGQVHE